MAISDPTIDPITGLPLLNPSDVVQQIPLGVQAFPWQDMGATALPTRGPLYGDDILPVSAFVAGQHPQTGSAQTVQTDGNHRLLVSTGAAASVGVSPIDMQYNRSTYVGGANVSNPAAVLQIPSNMRYLYSISGGIIVQGNAPPTDQGINFMLGIGGGGGFGQLLFLWTDMVFSNGTAPFVEPHRLPVDWQPCAPLDLWQSLDNSGDWWMTLSWTDNPHITRVDFATAWVWGA